MISQTQSGATPQHYPVNQQDRHMTLVAWLAYSYSKHSRTNAQIQLSIHSKNVLLDSNLEMSY